MNQFQIIRLITVFNILFIYWMLAVPAKDVYDKKNVTPAYVFNMPKKDFVISINIMKDSGFVTSDFSSNIQDLFNKRVIIKSVENNVSSDVVLSKVYKMKGYSIVGYLNVSNEQPNIFIRNDINETNKEIYAYSLKVLFQQVVTDSVLIKNKFFEKAVSDGVSLNENEFKKNFFESKLFTENTNSTAPFGLWVFIGIIMSIIFLMPFIDTDDFEGGHIFIIILMLIGFYFHAPF